MQINFNTLKPSLSFSNCALTNSFGMPIQSILKKNQLFKNNKNKHTLKKINFLLSNRNLQKVILLNKSIRADLHYKKYYKVFYKFFKKISYNSTTKQKTWKFLTYLIMYFLITHDLNLFVKKLTVFLQNTPRRFQLKIIRSFVLLNQRHFKLIFDYFFVSGLYFKISGKFGGIGGSKKLKKKLVWFKPKFSDRNLKIQRVVSSVWSFSGTTTWSVYALYK